MPKHCFLQRSLHTIHSYTETSHSHAHCDTTMPTVKQPRTLCSAGMVGNWSKNGCLHMHNQEYLHQLALNCVGIAVNSELFLIKSNWTLISILWQGGFNFLQWFIFRVSVVISRLVYSGYKWSRSHPRKMWCKYILEAKKSCLHKKEKAWKDSSFIKICKGLPHCLGWETG